MGHEPRIGSVINRLASVDACWETILGGGDLITVGR